MSAEFLNPFNLQCATNFVLICWPKTNQMNTILLVQNSFRYFVKVEVHKIQVQVAT